MFSIINANCHRSLATCRDHTHIRLLAGKHLSQALDSAAEANESVDARLPFELAGCRIDDGINKDHRRASGEVARPLSVIAAPHSPKICPRLLLADAWPDLATKASEPSRDASYRPSYLSWQGVGKSAAGSEQLATWFTGWTCGVQADVGLSGFCVARREGTMPKYGSTPPFVPHTCAVPGSHRELPGTHGGALHGAHRAPTATDGSDGRFPASPNFPDTVRYGKERG